MHDIISAAAIVGGLLGLIALMPDFQQKPGAGWDAQEDDELQP